MEQRGRTALAFVLMVVFVMMIMGPIASLETWLAGLVVAAVLVPVILLLGLRWSRGKVDVARDDMFTWRGMTEEEYVEERDPDDFEGEID